MQIKLKPKKDKSKPHKWFAWYPVIATEGDPYSASAKAYLCWWCYVEREKEEWVDTYLYNYRIIK
jgi:hypothetical protein